MIEVKVMNIVTMQILAVIFAILWFHLIKLINYASKCYIAAKIVLTMYFFYDIIYWI